MSEQQLNNKIFHLKCQLKREKSGGLIQASSPKAQREIVNGCWNPNWNLFNELWLHMLEPLHSAALTVARLDSNLRTCLPEKVNSCLTVKIKKTQKNRRTLWSFLDLIPPHQTPFKLELKESFCCWLQGNWSLCLFSHISKLASQSRKGPKGMSFIHWPYTKFKDTQLNWWEPWC